LSSQRRWLAALLARRQSAAEQYRCRSRSRGSARNNCLQLRHLRRRCGFIGGLLLGAESCQVNQSTREENANRHTNNRKRGRREEDGLIENRRKKTRPKKIQLQIGGITTLSGRWWHLANLIEAAYEQFKQQKPEGH